MSIEKAVGFLVARAADAIKAVEGDYIDEATGLLMCGKCHTAKQTRVELFGRAETPMCLCRCESERVNAAAEAYRERRRREYLEAMRAEGIRDEAMRSYTFANDDMLDERVTEAMRRYVEAFEHLYDEGRGLLLYGSTGTGKTYAACEVANELFEHGYLSCVTNFAEILREMQGAYDKRDCIDRLARYDLLVIDDLGIERDTAYAREQVYAVIDARYRAKKPMIITTNLSLTDIAHPQDINSQRIYDRILERCTPIEVSGKNRRRRAVSASYDEMRQLLGLQ